MGTRNVGDVGPSWNDVLVAMEELERATGRLVSVEVCRTASTTRPSRPYFRVVARERARGRAPAGEKGAGYPWPHIDYRTVPAMLLHLLHTLDRALLEAEKAEARQASF
jgi:hypothetical protein